MKARDEILARIRTALADHPAPAAVARDYRRNQGPGSVELFVERLEDYRASVYRDTDVDAILARRGIARVVVPDGMPERWLPSVAVQYHEPMDTATLDEVSAVVTTCAVAIAETGTIVLDAGPGQGPRALSLVPDYHLVVVRADQIKANVPDAIVALEPTRPLTWISGPSATSDIELSRVEGVHGPRTLDVLIGD